jgi:hypothetical protein
VMVGCGGLVWVCGAGRDRLTFTGRGVLGLWFVGALKRRRWIGGRSRAAAEFRGAPR